MDTKIVKEVIDLTATKKRIAAELDAVKKALAKKEAQLVDAFTNEGVDSTKIDGTTVYLRTEIRCHVRSAEAAAAYLHRLGLGEMAPHRANANKMSAYVREILRSGEELPTEWDRYFEVVEEVKVGVRA